jgi:hypothetical protein
MALDLLRKSESEACHQMIRTFHDQFRHTPSKFKNTVPKNGWIFELESKITNENFLPQIKASVF